MAGRRNQAVLNAKLICRNCRRGCSVLGVHNFALWFLCIYSAD
jgi:hypothetical protein